MAHSVNIRHFLLAFAFGYWAKKWLKPILLPFGTAIYVPPEDRAVFADIDPDNDSLKIKHGRLSKIYERVPEDSVPKMLGPETVLVDNDGTVYVLTEEAKLVSLTDFEEQGGDSVKVMATATEVVNLGMGRPLGGKFTKDNTLYVADTLLGLIRVKNPQKKGAKVELVASRIKVDGNTSSPILYANDVTIGPKTGMVYFTDATDIAPERIGTRTWDTLYMAKMDLLRGKRAGRLLRYDPKTDEVAVLATGIGFANGLGIDKDETFLAISETFGARVLKYHLTGDKEGTVEVMADGFTGYPDGCDCSWTNGLCYAALPSCALPLLKFISKLPHPIDMVLRTLIMALPKSLSPKVMPYGGVAEFHPENGTTRILQDPTGQDMGMVAGVTIHEDKVYMGSLKNEFIGVYDLA